MNMVISNALTAKIVVIVRDVSIVKGVQDVKIVSDALSVHDVKIVLVQFVVLIVIAASTVQLT